MKKECIRHNTALKGRIAYEAKKKKKQQQEQKQKETFNTKEK